jgi:4-amino-4-deoxy-L-arabinose transferase-like glycosyltransferase
MPQVRDRSLRPRLLPNERWARIALALLVVFALARGVLWASTQPGWFAPDEDYHWLYTEHMLIDKSWPDLDEPFATQELFVAVTAIGQGVYYAGPRTEYRGDPHASVRWLSRHGGLREATGEPPRPVLHPPAYHVGAALVDRVVTGEVAPVRLTAIRYYSACLGALLVFLAWLLAAQILAQRWQQLAVAAVVATQPQLAFSSSTVTNDVLVACGYAAVLAWCAWLLRSEPDRRQGWALGAIVGLALLTKATALVVAAAAVLTLVLLWRVHRERVGEVRGIALRSGAAALAIAGWWYVVLLAETGSLFGNKGAFARSTPPVDLIATVQVWFVDLQSAWDWLRDAYWTYWVFQFPYEVGPMDGWEFVPLAAGAVGVAGLALFVWRSRSSVFDPARPALRQAVVLVSAPIGVTLPFFLVDMWRSTHGLPFSTATGRFSLAAYTATATLFVLALSELAGRRRARQFPLIAGAVVLSFAYYVHTYATWGLERYYGPLGEALHHATWDKPAWVTEGFLWTLIIVAALSFVASTIVVAVGTRREHAAADAQPSEPPSQQVSLRLVDHARP